MTGCSLTADMVLMPHTTKAALGRHVQQRGGGLGPEGQPCTPLLVPLHLGEGMVK